MPSESLTLRRISKAHRAMNNSQSDWGKEYWASVISELKKYL